MSEFPKMLSKEIEINNPMGGKIKRLVPLRYGPKSPKVGQLVILHDEHDEKVYNQEVPDVEPVMSHMEQDTSHHRFDPVQNDQADFPIHHGKGTK